MENILLTPTTKADLVNEILQGVSLLIKESQDNDLTKNEWLTSKEVQTILKITPTTLWNYDNKGITQPQRIGNRKRYHRPQIIKLLQQKESKRA
jgi:hypothetical protein